jgi:acetyl-CoA carboxylase biotin carboxyl carrier protein
VTRVPLSDEDVREILRLIDESDLDELRVETEGLSLHVVRNGAAPGGADVEDRPWSTSAPPGVSDLGSSAPGKAREPAVERGAHTIVSPMLGTFYRAPAPGALPFVDVGTRVDPDTIVCIIEVMKMMNSVPAGMAGTIVEIHAENADAVEYGQPLFGVEPA